MNELASALIPALIAGITFPLAWSVVLEQFR